MRSRNEISEMISGIFLLLGIHILVFAVLGFLSSIIANLFAIYTVVQILAISIFCIASGEGWAWFTVE